MKAGQIDSAEANVREALTMYEHMFPDSDSIEIARSRHFLARVLKDKRSYGDAVQMLRSSRSVYRTLSKWIHVAISCREQRFVEFFLFFVQLLPYFPFSTAFFLQLTSTISRIELLRGNAEEAIRLNVREIEALQVRFPCHLMQERPLNRLAGGGPSTF